MKNKKIIWLGEFTSIATLAKELGITESIIVDFINNFTDVDDMVDFDTATSIAEKYDVEARLVE
jgi:hypothetical protein